jgi:imidazolonepropionase-like amidohydrolase
MYAETRLGNIETGFCFAGEGAGGNMEHSWGAVLVLAAGLLAAGCTGGTPAPAAGEGEPQTAVTLALVNGTLIDGTGADPVPEAVILIAGDRLAAVGPAASVQVPPGVETIDLGGRTVLPGFINAHVHYGYDTSNLQAWAQGGVTTVRDEGVISDWTLAEVSAFLAEVRGDARYARLVSAGFMITVPGGYGGLYVSMPDEARQKVFEELDAGVDLIKVSLEDGYAGRSGLPKLTSEELAAIVAAAHARGTLVSGNITQAAYLQPMLDAGVDDIAHVPYDAIPSASLKQMVQQGVYLTPTFTVYRNYGAPVAGCVANLRQFVRLGGKVALGNDFGGGPGDFETGIPMYEIENMAAAGMTPMQVIVASTKNAAHVANMESEIGTLEAGKIADILVVDGDPLADLQALTGVRLVIHDGVIIRDEIRK